MRRLIDQDLDGWATAPRRKPLIVRGARQVGKTYSIRELGRRRFPGTVIIDLERNRDWHRVFAGNLDPRRILADLELLAGRRIEPGRTLLFLDEIQACPAALTALRYFYEELPELHVVAAGSLLEFALGALTIPVGRVQFLELHPMTFLETLWAAEHDTAAELVARPPVRLTDATHHFLLDEVRRYCFVGGMPEAVQAYLSTHSLQEAFTVHRELCETYRQDFPRYAPRSDPRCLDQVFQSVARQVGGQIVYTRLTSEFTGPTAKAAFELLCQARVIRRVPTANPAGLPLGASNRPNRFKALLLDVGLWQHLSGMNAAAAYAQEDLLAVYRGALAEQFVGQELLVAQRGELYYWARDAPGSTAEVDYLALAHGALHGVEVKSGAAGALRSLHLLLKEYPNVAQGLVFQSGPYAELPEQRLTFLPLYAVAGGARPSEPPAARSQEPAT